MGPGERASMSHLGDLIRRSRNEQIDADTKGGMSDQDIAAKHGITEAHLRRLRRDGKVYPRMVNQKPD